MATTSLCPCYLFLQAQRFRDHLDEEGADRDTELEEELLSAGWRDDEMCDDASEGDDGTTLVEATSVANAALLVNDDDVDRVMFWEVLASRSFLWVGRPHARFCGWVGAPLNSPPILPTSFLPTCSSQHFCLCNGPAGDATFVVPAPGHGRGRGPR